MLQILSILRIVVLIRFITCSDCKLGCIFDCVVIDYISLQGVISRRNWSSCLKQISTFDKIVNSNETLYVSFVVDSLPYYNDSMLLPITFPLPFVIIGDVGELGSVFPEVHPLKKASGSEVIVRERLNFFLKCKKYIKFSKI